jgi:HPt (histidine-containing phosphotransfer) domain-containing protein
MDDHLAKPYTRWQLCALMMRWLPARLIESTAEPVPDVAAAQVAGPATPTVSAVVDEGALIDAAALDNIRSLEEEGDTSVLDEVITIYLNEAPHHLDGLRAALAGGRGADLKRIAHAYKSASCNVGAMQLGELCRQLERLAAVGETGGCAEVVASIESMSARVTPLLRDLMGQPA